MTHIKSFMRREFWTSDLMVIGYFAVINLVLHLVAIGNYNYFRDELYYIACSDHLTFGYVDHPPLAMLLLKIIRWVLGDSLFAIRLLPVLGSATFVFLTGLTARELGGRKLAMILAAAAAFAPIGNFFTMHIYSMNFLDLLFWLACFLILIRIVKTGNPKYWLLFGLVVGLGLQNKISLLFLCFGVGVGILLTDERKHLKSKYLWLGAGIAGLLFLPYILWNMSHGWPTLEFMHNAHVYKMAKVTPLEFLREQILYNNPATLLIWLVGLWFFFFNSEGKKYRLFGWMYVTIYILFTIQSAKSYYLAAAYPILFAGGAVMWETWLQRKRLRPLGPVLIILIILPTLVVCPITLPILQPEAAIHLLDTLGLEANAGENHEMGPLPQHYADMFGWEEMAAKTAKVYNTLSPEEQKECIIYATNYGEAGAINFFGKRYGLPTAYSGHNSHFFWRPEGVSGNIIIVVGGREEDHLKSYREVTKMDSTYHKYAMPYENGKGIFICRGIKRPLEEVWQSTKLFI